MKQISIILPTNRRARVRAAARRCVEVLEDYLPGFSVLDVPSTDPSEPSDERIGEGVVRGWWTSERDVQDESGNGSKETVVHRDRSVLVFADIEPAFEVMVEEVMNKIFPVFFESYLAAGEPQESLYLAVQGTRRVEFRNKGDQRPWRLGNSTL